MGQTYLYAKPNRPFFFRSSAPPDKIITLSNRITLISQTECNKHINYRKRLQTTWVVFNKNTSNAICFCFDALFAREIAKRHDEYLARKYVYYIRFAKNYWQTTGKRSEKLVFDACNSPDKPNWMIGARYSSNQEDNNGIDIIVSTDFGEFPLQIKSSLAGIKKFIWKYYIDNHDFHIGLVKILKTDTEEM